MQKRVLISLITVLEAVVYSFGVIPEDYNLQTKALWANKKGVEIQRILKIGADDLDKPDYLFGYITDFAIGQDDNIYVLDFKNSRAQKYTPEGEFIHSYGKGFGQGPGEFIHAAQIGIDRLGNVYIGDKNTRKISIFDSNGVFSRSMLLDKVAPTSCILIDRMMKLFVGVDPHYMSSGIWKKGIYQIYSSSGDIIGSLGSTMEKKDASMNIGGNSICLDKRNDNIIVSYAMPYKIEIYSSELKLKSRFGRKSDYFFENIKREDIVYSYGSSYRVVVLSDGKIINLIRYIQSKKGKDDFEIKNCLDVFDEDGNYLISIAGDRFNEAGKEIRGMRVDQKGNLYLAYEDPFPYIEKYCISFVDLR